MSLKRAKPCVIMIAIKCVLLPIHYRSSVVESFETIASMYAQQRAVNETQSFVSPSLTLVTESVSTVNDNNNNYYR